MPKTISRQDEAVGALDALDLNSTDDASDLRQIGDLVDERVRVDDELAEAVAAARAQGRSWTAIGLALGVSRQAAHNRFANRAGR